MQDQVILSTGTFPQLLAAVVRHKANDGVVYVKKKI